MQPPRWISCFETHIDHPQKWDFRIHHRRSAEKEPNRAKQLYIRLTGSRTVTNRYTSHFRIGCDILEGQERSWGWVLGLSFCVWLFGCLSFFSFFFLLRVVVACLCVIFFGFITSCSHNLFFFTKKLNDYFSLSSDFNRFRLITQILYRINQPPSSLEFSLKQAVLKITHCLKFPLPLSIYMHISTGNTKPHLLQGNQVFVLYICNPGAETI
jgi:hypothetical protein